ncbi:PilN domain-containing protein [Halanaerobium hydrogeniformans]|nr:PilN domain-containing protein [Halanaerobium hydrogeniformans]
MLIIFKEKNFELKDKVIKYSIIILLFTLFLLSVLNYYLVIRQRNIKAEVMENINMIDKYNSLSQSLEIKTDEIKPAFSDLLSLLSSYSQNLSYESLIINQEKVIINGSTKEKENIIKLLEILESDNYFMEPELKTINAAENYNFQIETRLRE